MAMADIQVREGISFEWLDDPSTPNRRWRARMSREVFAALVKEKLGIALAETRPGRTAADSHARRAAGFHAQNQKRNPL